MEQTTRPKTVGDALDEQRELSTFNQLLRRSKVISQIDGGGQYTVFAPDNGAFEALPPNAIGEIVNRPRLLEDFVRHHIVSGLYPRHALNDQVVMRDLMGNELTVVDVHPGPYVGGARLRFDELTAENGIIHVIETVLMPDRT